MQRWQAKLQTGNTQTGKASGRQCSDRQRVSAGHQGEVVIWQHDQFGNQVTRRAAHGQFVANAQGPGAMETQLVLGDAGKVTLQ